MKKNQLLGLAFIVLAIIILLQQLGMFPYIPVTKMIMIVLLGWYFVNSLLKLDILGIIVGFVGLLFTLEGIFYTVLPIAKDAIILIAAFLYIGLSLLMKKR